MTSVEQTGRTLFFSLLTAVADYFRKPPSHPYFFLSPHSTSYYSLLRVYTDLIRWPLTTTMKAVSVPQPVNTLFKIVFFCGPSKNSFHTLPLLLWTVQP